MTPNPTKEEIDALERKIKEVEALEREIQDQRELRDTKVRRAVNPARV